jgi:hypothetical protein
MMSTIIDKMKGMIAVEERRIGTATDNIALETGAMIILNGSEKSEKSVVEG